MKPPEVERMEESISLFEQGQLEEGWDGFIEAIFGPPRNSSTRFPPLPRTEEDLEKMRSFGYDQPVAMTWCPSEAELNQLTQPVLIIKGDRTPSVLRNISDLLDGKLSNSKLITLEGQNHMMCSAAPKLVAEKLTTFIYECESRENP
jgi:pimeloyl-ACP methyl ester carboxylesterase